MNALPWSITWSLSPLVNLVNWTAAGDAAGVWSDRFLLAVLGPTCIWVYPLSTFVPFRVFHGRKILIAGFIRSYRGVKRARSSPGGRTDGGRRYGWAGWFR